MSWDAEEFRNWLSREHDRIYDDIDRMCRQIADDPSRYRYSNFISQEVGALNLCVRLKDSSSLDSIDALNAELSQLRMKSDEYFESDAQKSELDRQEFEKGWLGQISRIEEGFLTDI